MVRVTTIFALKSRNNDVRLESRKRNRQILEMLIIVPFLSCLFFFVRVVDDVLLLFAFADQGSDDQEADGNPDGYVRDNKIYRNRITSAESQVMEINEAEDNSFWVRVRFFFKVVINRTEHF